MPKMLEKLSLLDDLASVKSIFAVTPEDDIMSRISFEERMHVLEKRLQDMSETPDRTASIALMFNGSPVYGSRSIDADFAVNAIGRFQDIVSKTYAENSEDGLSENGRKIPYRDVSTLQISQVARGSFGFVLEEKPSDQVEMLQSKLLETVNEVSNILTSIYDESDTAYANIVDSINSRVFNAIKVFYELLYKSGATLRLVDTKSDESLGREEITRAYERLTATVVEESELNLVGRLVGVGPVEQRFEFEPDNQQTIVGRTGPRLGRTYLQRIKDQGLTLGHRFAARIQQTIITKPNGRTDKKYVLLDLNELENT